MKVRSLFRQVFRRKAFLVSVMRKTLSSIVPMRVNHLLSLIVNANHSIVYVHLFWATTVPLERLGHPVSYLKSIAYRTIRVQGAEDQGCREQDRR